MDDGSGATFKDILFFPKLSHELKAPVHGINGLSSYLVDNWDTLKDEVKHTSIKDVAVASEQLKDLVEKLFDLSVINSGTMPYNFAEVDVVEIAQRAIMQNRVFITEKNPINISLESQQKEFRALIDPLWANQLLYNLIYNAVKHSAASNIKVKITSSNEGAADHLIFSVVDDGVGIPQQELGNIFAPFAQGENAKKIGGGSGLGLTICQDIVKKHGGKIWAENNHPQGTVISFTLPIKK